MSYSLTVPDWLIILPCESPYQKQQMPKHRKRAQKQNQDTTLERTFDVKHKLIFFQMQSYVQTLLSLYLFYVVCFIQNGWVFLDFFQNIRNYFEKKKMIQSFQEMLKSHIHANIFMNLVSDSRPAQVRHSDQILCWLIQNFACIYCFISPGVYTQYIIKPSILPF